MLQRLDSSSLPTAAEDLLLAALESDDQLHEVVGAITLRALAAQK